ncbi:hypothetical protein L596_021213 [Steinernema carpocapsae]|uniref:Nuclear receptor domain-containing protein n=1 Tax=Steinernema carpocapsae TaxID=34508 RepID=A0A4U5MW42_STECR|nr:hypothetical protein L596_021213 [Steinernema carpocapsae]
MSSISSFVNVDYSPQQKARCVLWYVETKSMIQTQLPYNYRANMIGKMNTTDPLCRICGNMAEEVASYNVASCQACAAFFRYAEVENEVLMCEGGYGTCDVTQLNCGYCRFQRCLSAGMTLGCWKWQENEFLPDPPTSDSSCYSQHYSIPENTISRNITSTHSSTHSLPNFANAEDELLEKFSDMKIEGHHLKFDTDIHMNEVVQLLNKPYKGDKRKSESILGSMISAFRSMIPEGRSKNIKFIRTIGWKDYMRFVMSHLKRIAKWAMACEEFANLPLEDKRQIFLGAWNHIYLIERVHRSVQFLGENFPANSTLFTDALAGNLLDTDLYEPEIQPEILERINTQFKPLYMYSWRNFEKPMRDLKLTEFEVVYICFYKLWYVKNIKGLSPETRRVADDILEKTSSELHQMYLEELRLRVYSIRLSKIFDTLTSLEDVLRKRQEALLMSHATGVMKTDLDESEFMSYFNDYCFSK